MLLLSKGRNIPSLSSSSSIGRRFNHHQIALIFLIITLGYLLLGGLVESSTLTCTDVDSEGCGLRGYIKERQKEEHTLSCSITKLAKAIEFLKDANQTNLVEQITLREQQLRVKESARSLLTSEISLLSIQCSTLLGENCDIPVQCYGIDSNLPTVCSGHGICVASNSCQCYSSFSGPNCSLTSTTNDPILGRTFADGTTATSCYGYRYPTAPYTYNEEGSGLYQINVGPTIYTAYCDMESMGGGWTLLMKTSSASPYRYNHDMWTATDLILQMKSMKFSNITANEDYVSPLFYKLAGTESRLAMGSLENYNSWTHSYGTARNLINTNMMTSSSADMSASTCDPQTNCGTQPIHKKPLGIWRALPYNFVSTYWYRFGYVNAKDTIGFGAMLRVGFTSDGNTDDNVEGKIGIGIDCITQCATYDVNPHYTGSGYYYQRAHNPGLATNGAMMGWLWIR